MVLGKLAEAIIKNPKLLNSSYTSNPKLAKRFKISIEQVLVEKQKARQILNATPALKQSKIVGSDSNIDSGEEKIEVKSPTKLSIDEIKKIVGADDINISISRVWHKSSNNGVDWDYSVFVKHNIKDFYSPEEFREKLKEIFPQQNVINTLPLSRDIPNKKSLAIFISDDHIGMVMDGTIFGSKMPDADYESRLLKIVSYVKSIQGIFDKIVVYSLGDQLNGFNQQTTRGGHIVSSTSNKEQFDVYTKARKVFYDALFTSGKASSYAVVETNDSNHSGSGFSYMANELLKLYVNTKYPEVEFDNSEDFVIVTSMQGHVIVTLHGKDAKEQKSGFPLNLDTKTEVWFTDFLLEYGINPKDNSVHIYKGDLHRFNENTGKNFRYINVPSISTGSVWQEKNFGTSRAGALIEIYETGDPEPLRKVIRF